MCFWVQNPDLRPHSTPGPALSPMLTEAVEGWATSVLACLLAAGLGDQGSLFLPRFMFTREPHSVVLLQRMC